MGTPEKREVDFSKLNFARLAHNYFTETKESDYGVEDLNVLNGYLNYLFEPRNQDLPKYKVGIMLVCINRPYWQYAKPVIDGIKAYFLPGHETEVMVWSDIPARGSKEEEAILVECEKAGEQGTNRESADAFFKEFDDLGVKIFRTDSIEWPYPTLMRYHLFLAEEEYLKQFDYLFYLDLDMRVINVVGDEILPKEGLMAAQHPMYALDRKFMPPYEPNPASASYIPRPGRVLEEGGKRRFEALYFAGGFQGGRTEAFIDAMKKTKGIIDADLDKNYIPLWNDESAWNKYLFENPPTTVLSPSYVYPDSMINEYYIRVWGKNYPPKIITLTKPFTTSSEGGAAAAKMVQQLQGI